MTETIDALTYTGIAGQLTELSDAYDRRVTANQVYMWYQRRGRNGFPSSVGRAKAANGLAAPVFSFADVLDWWVRYVPSKGGAPKGNRNNPHGRNGFSGGTS